MNNVHPLFKTALAPIAPSLQPGLKPFCVSIRFNGENRELNTLAFTACDAIVSAIDIYFDGEETMPNDLRIEAHPMNLLPAA